MKISRLLFAAVIAAKLGAQTDPGPRLARQPARPLAGVTASELKQFQDGLSTFVEQDGVPNGLGPRFNLDGCAGCHVHPAIGGSSPVHNPQIPGATRAGARNTIPPFLQPDGPIRVVRFRHNPDGSPDGGVHDLFVITGRSDAPSGCQIAQPDFSNAANLTFRIPTPLFGAGLIEAIPDSTLRANLAANPTQKQQLGIAGRFNTNGNDGTITRFGWKAQNKSLLLFSGEAYNVEVGVTNEMFPQEREEDPNCASNTVPEDHTNVDTGEFSDIEKFTQFMRYLAPPPPVPSNPSIDQGRALFASVGCAQCHTPSLKTGNSFSAALANQTVPLYSDLALHRMGHNLADGVSQGVARGDEFRTAPLWGLGARIFLLHDGRSRDLNDAILQHDSQGSEAHAVIVNYGALPAEARQDLLNFLRAL